MTNEITKTESSVDLRDARAVKPVGETHVIFILDRSGSMNEKQEDVIGGFNSAIDVLKEGGEDDCFITYVRFDSLYEKIWNATPLGSVPKMSDYLYAPRGSTALLDAVGKTIKETENNPDNRYIVVTHTDGYENASHEFKRDEIAALISERTALGNWTFSFFGSDFDAWAEAGSMGAMAGNTMAYSGAQTGATFSSTSRVSNVMRSRGMSNTSWYAAATAAASEGASDADLEEILKGNKDWKLPEDKKEAK